MPGFVRERAERSFTADDLTVAVTLMLDEDFDRGDSRGEHERPGGWYSSEVLAYALTSAFIDKRDRVEYKMELRPLSVSPEAIQDPQCVGALQNRESRHWVAIRKEAGRFWLLDSLYEPHLLTESMYNKLLQRFPATYAVVSVLPAQDARGDVPPPIFQEPEVPAARASSSSDRAVMDTSLTTGPRIVTGFGHERVENVAEHERASLRRAIDVARARRDQATRGRTRDFDGDDLDRSHGGPWQLGK